MKITHIVVILFLFMVTENGLTPEQKPADTETILYSHKYLCCHGEDHPVHDMLVHVHCITLFLPSMVRCTSILCCTNNACI